MVDLCSWRARIGLFSSRYCYCSSFNGCAGCTTLWQWLLSVVFALLSQLLSLLMSVIRKTNVAISATSVRIADLSGEEDRTFHVCVTTKTASLSLIIKRCCLLSLCVTSKLIAVFLLFDLLLLCGDVETNPGPPKAANLPLTIFLSYFYRMGKAFGETSRELASHFLAENLIGKETWDKVQLPQNTPMDKANILLGVVHSMIDADKTDKTLRKLCRLMSEHKHLKKLSNKIIKKYEAVLSRSEELSSSESDSSEDECDQSKAHPLPTQVQKYISYKKACYRENVFPNCLKHPTRMLNMASQYVELVLIKNEIKSGKQSQLMKKLLMKREGRIEEMCKSQGEISITMLDCLPDGSIPTRILVQGAPGIGKTTFAWELCRQWQAGVLLQNFSIVIMLQLRHKSIMQAKNLEELITDCTSDVRRALCSYLNDENGKGLFLILDGFDTVLQSNLSNECVIHQLLAKEVLPSATILVTTRPAAIEILPSSFLKQSSPQLEIIGFTEQGINTYIQSSCSDEPELLEDFHSYLATHPFSASVMCIPLCCAIITELYSNKWHSEDKNFAPGTVTELYTNLVTTLMLRYLSEHPVYCQQKLKIENLEDLPQEVYQQLMQLAKLASDGLEQQCYVFHNLPCDTLGLMHREQCLQLGKPDEISYSFLHITLQEYLATYYCCQQFSAEQKEHFKNDKKHNQKDEILWFCLAPVLVFITGFGFKKFQDYNMTPGGKQQTSKDSTPPSSTQSNPNPTTMVRTTFSNPSTSTDKQLITSSSAPAATGIPILSPAEYYHCQSIFSDLMRQCSEEQLHRTFPTIACVTAGLLMASSDSTAPTKGGATSCQNEPFNTTTTLNSTASNNLPFIFNNTDDFTFTHHPADNYSQSNEFNHHDVLRSYYQSGHSLTLTDSNGYGEPLSLAVGAIVSAIVSAIAALVYRYLIPLILLIVFIIIIIVILREIYRRCKR